MRDILNALAAYQRKPLVSNAELHALEEDGDALRESREFLDPSETSREHRRRAERGEPPKTIRTVGRGVWLKTFRNGNGHLFFGPEALRDINMALAEYYGDVLPDCPDAEAERPAPRAGSTAVAKDLQFYPTPRPVIDRILRDWNMTGLRVLDILETAGADFIFGDMSGPDVDFRIVGISDDCGPIDITVSMPSSVASMPYGLTRLVARGIIEALDVSERNDCFDVMINGGVSVPPGCPPQPVKTVEELAAEHVLELAYDEGFGGRYVLHRDGSLRSADYERDDDDGASL